MSSTDSGIRLRASDWWLAREPRERLMLVVMGIAVAAFVLWLGLLRPLQAWAEEARARHDRAAAGLAWVQSAVRELEARGIGQPAPQADQADNGFKDIILATAASARVEVTRQRTDEAGGLSIGIDAVGAPELFAWLDRLYADHGIAPVSMQVDKRNGALRVEVAFAARGTS